MLVSSKVCAKIVTWFFYLQNKIKGEEEISTFEQTQIDKAKKIMKPFILRRLKSDVLDSLPTKHEVVVGVTKHIFRCFLFN